MKKILSILLVFALIFSGASPAYVAARGNEPTLSTGKITLRVGISQRIKIKNKPKAANVSWKSSNKKIAVVKNGTVTGQKAGSAVITCNISYRMSGKKITKQLMVSVAVRSIQNVYPQHSPYGKGIGAKPGRVVWSYNPQAVDWNGRGYWWRTANFQEKTVLKMVRESVASLGGSKKVFCVLW